MSRRAMLIEALEATPRDLARSLRRVSLTTAAARPDPADWSIAEVVAHLAELEPRFLARLRRVAAEDNPTVPELHPEPSAHDPPRPPDELLAAFAEARAATVAFLNALEQRDWARPLVHASLGPMRLRDQVQALVSHDNEHLAQLATLRERLAGQGDVHHSRP